MNIHFILAKDGPEHEMTVSDSLGVSLVKSGDIGYPLSAFNHRYPVSSEIPGTWNTFYPCGIMSPRSHVELSCDGINPLIMRG